MQTTQVAETTDIINIITHSNILVKFILPVICVLLGIILIRYLIKYLLEKFANKVVADGEKERQEELRQKQLRQKAKKQRERQRQINAEFKDEEKMLQKLNNSTEPIDKSKYSDLTLIFDKNGKVIK